MSSATMKLLEEDVEAGGKEINVDGIENDFAYNNNVHNASVNIRLGNCLKSCHKVYHFVSHL